MSADYTLPILCLAAIGMMGWVVVLKAQITELNEQNRKLRAALDLRVHNMKLDVDVVAGTKSTGPRPQWMK
jgi:hypothetical protein